MKLYTAIICCYCSITFYCLSKSFLCRMFYTFIGTFNTLFSSYVILICQISCKISSLKIHRTWNIEWLDRFHQIVRHLCGSIYRNIFKTNISTPVNHKMTCLSIIIITVTPHSYLCCPVADCGIYICIKKPEWNVNTFDLINMILILEDLWQKTFSGQMFLQSFFCCLFI